MARILVIGSYAPSLLNFRGSLLQSLLRRGHAIAACATDSQEEDVTRLQSLGIDYHDIPLERRGLNPFKDLLYFWRLFRLIRSLKIDVVLSYTIKPVIYGSLAARCAGVACIASMITGLGYTFFAESAKGKALRMLAAGLYKFALRFNKVVFFQNRDDLALFQKMRLLGPQTRPVQIPGSGVDIHHFIPAPLPAKTTFLMIGRLTREKGVVDYLEAAAAIKTDYPEVEFLLLGNSFAGPSYLTEKDLNKYVEKGIVRYLGTCRDVRPVIADCTVFVLPTHGGEGIPRTILEAMAMARPIITTDTPGCREAVIDGENGRLIPPRCVSSLIDVMRRVVEGKEELARMAANSRTMAVERYDVHLVNQLIIAGMGL